MTCLPGRRKVPERVRESRVAPREVRARARRRRWRGGLALILPTAPTPTDACRRTLLSIAAPAQAIGDVSTREGAE